MNRVAALVAVSSTLALVGVVVSASTMSIATRPTAKASASSMAATAVEASAAGLAEDVSLEVVGEFGGAATAVDVVGGIAYLAVGPRLRVVDVSNPERPVGVGVTGILPNAIQEVDVEGTHAFLAADSAGLLVVDVGAPTAPRLVGRLDTYCRANHLDVSGSHAFVACSGHLLVIDVTEPHAPVWVGRLADFDGWRLDVDVSGSYAYVADGDTNGGSLDVIDISEPSRPTRVGSVATVSGPNALHVAGTFAYVVDSLGFRVFDVADPAHPRSVAELSRELGSGVDVDVAGSHAFVATGEGLTVIDIANPVAPRRLSWLWLPQYGGYYAGSDVCIRGDRAFLAVADGMRVVNVSDPAAPRLTGGLDAQYRESLGVVVRGTHAFVAAGRAGLVILDVADPTMPRELASVSVEAPTELGFSARAVAVDEDGDHAFVAAGGGGLWVVDVSDPTEPIVVGVASSVSDVGDQFYAMAVEVAEGIAYVVAGNRRFLVFDVSVPYAPRVVGSVDVEQGFRQATVVLVGTHAYVASYACQVIDVTDRTAPRVVARLHEWGECTDVAVAFSHAYLATDRGMLVFDVADPASPREVGAFAMDYATTVDLAGHLAYLSGPSGLQVLDVRNPAAPVEIAAARIPMLGYAPEDLFLASSHAFVAAGDSGLLVIRADVPSPVGVCHLPVARR